jgi:hypothetical protein
MKRDPHYNFEDFADYARKGEGLGGRSSRATTPPTGSCPRASR